MALHLIFVGVAVTCESLFDGRRRIFDQRQIGQGGCQQGCAASLADSDGSCYISPKEKLFNGNFMRLELTNEFLDVQENLA